MKDLRQVVESNPGYPELLFVYQGDEQAGEEFFQRYWPEARAVSDPKNRLYEAFGLERAGFRELFNPEVMACSISAASKGNFVGKPVGDARMMPGAFLIENGEVVWQHTYRHIADHPDFASVRAIENSVESEYAATV